MNIRIDIFATLAEVIAFAYFFYEKEREAKKRTILKVVCSIIMLDGGIHIFTYLKVPLTQKIFFLIILCSIVGKFLYNKNWKKCLFQSTVFVIFLNIGDLIVQGAISGLFQQPLPVLLQDSKILIVGIFVSKILLFILLFFLKIKMSLNYSSQLIWQCITLHDY